MKYLFTSESVTEGHPDKICDQISDALLDAYLSKDPNSHVAIETLVTENFVLVTGEVTSNHEIDIESIVRNQILGIGYNKDEYGFNGNTCEVVIKIKKQSEDINIGVLREGGVIGAGDQGIMFGYACDETSTYMPLPIFFAHLIVKKLDEVRKNKLISYLRPDGKSQVTICYDKEIYIDTILISNQHDEIDSIIIRKDIIEKVINQIPELQKYIKRETNILINPTGRFVIGGPKGDSGLTGRKIIVDTYGGYSRHGGGAFSGKDATKVDRSAAYMARYIAKNLVAAKVATKLELQLSYAIGLENPISIYVETFGTGKYKNNDIVDMINAIFDLRPSKIIQSLELYKPIYNKLAKYGQIGREDLNVSFEKLDKVEEITNYLSKQKLIIEKM
jgi:S-adenosylmethionine synthetase